jgi:hypothetical protein
LKLKVIVEEPAKPRPVTVTEVPTGPFTGLRLIEAATVNSAPALLPLLSVTVTVWLPKVDDGTANVTPVGKAPEAVDAEVVTVKPS